MKNNKGAALMQVLLITLVLAGISTMLLRVTLSRTTSARQTRRNSSAEVLIQACMAEVNSLWANKTEDVFLRDIQGGISAGDKDTRESNKHYNQPIMYCKNPNVVTGKCPVEEREYEYTCTYQMDNYNTYTVTATFEKVREKDSDNTDKDIWKLVYRIQNKNTL